MDSAAFAQATGATPGQMAKLTRYADLLIRWQARINLIAPSTLRCLWERHFLDSAQLLPLIPTGAHRLVDIGSGAGLPGLVLAILGVPEVHLIESDQRKAVFLDTVSRETATPVTVHAKRLDQVTPFIADVVTARAFAPLPALVIAASRFAGPTTVGLFPKGRDVDRELTQVPRTPKITIERLPSRTDPTASLLRVQGLGRE